MGIRISKVSLVLARESRRVTQAELAAAVDIGQGTISKLETGILTSVEESVAKRIALRLAYPLEFFTEELEDQPLPAVFYRRKASLKAIDERAIRAQVNIARRSIGRLLASVDIPDCRVPSIDLTGSLRPEQAARELRAQWGIQRGPIDNMVGLLERAGVVVVRADFGGSEVDAVSVPGFGRHPIIFVSGSLPGDRMRFTLAHELAHIIFHHHQAIPDQCSEDDALRFAGEFLAPAQDVRPFLLNLSLEKLASLKRHWRLSMACLLMRAEATGRITEWKAKQLWGQLGKLGYRSLEPVPIPPETITLFPELIRVHIEEFGYTLEELNRAMVGDFSAFVEKKKPGLRAVK